MNAIVRNHETLQTNDNVGGGPGGFCRGEPLKSKGTGFTPSCNVRVIRVGPGLHVRLARCRIETGSEESRGHKWAGVGAGEKCGVVEKI